MLKNKVSEFRAHANLTQKQLADIVDVSRQTIIAIEKGNYNPSVTLSLKIAACFKEPLEKVFFLEK